MRLLADVIPAADVDRWPIWDALVRLNGTGDDLAGRALLQLLVPGMTRLASKWGLRLPGGRTEAGWEVITCASKYIARLGSDGVRSGAPSYVLRSIHRDLVIQAKHDAAWATLLTGDGDDAEPQRPQTLTPTTTPSAEETYLTGNRVPSLLASAVRRRVLTPQAAQMTLLVMSGLTVNEAADRTTGSAPTFYRYRTAAAGHLRRELQVAS